MITPIELQSKTFKTGIGFDKKDVELFISSLLGDYETLYKENVELKDKCNVLNEGINYYKTIEKTIQKALVLAEKTGEETKEAARKEAYAIEQDARAKAKYILMDAQSELEKIHQQTIQLIRQYEAYKAQFKHLAEAQQELLESDAFNIHIANLDAFVNQKDVMKEEKCNDLQTDNSKNIQNDVSKNDQKNIQNDVSMNDQKAIQKDVSMNNRQDARNDISINNQKDIQINASFETQNDIFADDQMGNNQVDNNQVNNNQMDNCLKKNVYDDFEFLNVSDD